MILQAKGAETGVGSCNEVRGSQAARVRKYPHLSEYVSRDVSSSSSHTGLLAVTHTCLGSATLSPYTVLSVGMVLPQPSAWLDPSRPPLSLCSNVTFLSEIFLGQRF